MNGMLKRALQAILFSIAMVGAMAASAQSCSLNGVPCSYSDAQAVAAVNTAGKTYQLYASDGTAKSVGPSSGARTSMLPPPLAGTTLTIPANSMPIGASLLLTGDGVISAKTTTPGTFTFTPVVTPSGGSKTDLGGVAVTPLIGVQGVCSIRMTITQTASGLLTSGFVSYGLSNNNPYIVPINTTMTIVASDPTVDRLIGVEGQWQVSDAANYVTAQNVVIQLQRPR